MTPRRGFTLIELLVTIGIICILLALFLPVAGKIRDQARTAHCASNMSQIYHSVLAYTQDNQDALFYTPADFDTTMNFPYVYRMVTAGQIDFTQGVLWPYISLPSVGNGMTTASSASAISFRQSIFNCPSDGGELPTTPAGVMSRNFAYSFNAGIDYLISTPNAGYTGNIKTSPTSSLERFPHTTTIVMNPSSTGYTPSMRLGAIVAPSHKILIWEEVAPNDGWCDVDGTDANDYPSQRHALYGKHQSNNANANTANNVTNVAGGSGGGMGNQCFADGHVELMSPFEIWNQAFYCDLHGWP